MIKGERMKFHANKLAVAVAGCALSLSGFSQAQQLEEVVVTAAKVEASIQDTPIAVTAFSQEALDSQLINDASALQFGSQLEPDKRKLHGGRYSNPWYRIRCCGYVW